MFEELSIPVNESNWDFLVSGQGRPTWETARKWAPDLTNKNHKVVSVEPIEDEDVYDISVEGHHNFAIDLGDGSGVFTHNTGEWNSRYNPLNLTADLFWPVRKGSESKIDYIGSDPNVSGIADIEFLRDKLFAGLKIPKAFIGGDGYASVRTGLAQVSAEFGRFVSRNQRACKRGLAQMGMIHLAVKGLNPEDPANAFTIGMSPISNLDQQQRMESLTMAANLAVQLRSLGQTLDLPDEGMKNWIATNILGLVPMDFQSMGLAANTAAPQSQVVGVNGEYIRELSDSEQHEITSSVVEAILKDTDLQEAVSAIGRRDSGFSSRELNPFEDGGLPGTDIVESISLFSECNEDDFYEGE
jgi:hypothetical protein